MSVTFLLYKTLMASWAIVDKTGLFDDSLNIAGQE